METLAKAGILGIAVDSYDDGVSFTKRSYRLGEDPRDYFPLRLPDDRQEPALSRRYATKEKSPLGELEQYLMKLSRRGVLRRTEVFLGSLSDPFHPFQGKFESSMKFLELFKRYTPGMLHVQTRSPLLVIGLPVLQALGNRVGVTMGIETHLSEAVRRYTPRLPQIEDRLKTVKTLRRFGIEVTLQVGPVLPYGDWRRDPASFAELLIENADYIHVSALSDGKKKTERKIKNSTIAKKLAQDRKFHWLRPDAATPLITAIEALAPEKLLVPKRQTLSSKQLDIFAA